MPAEISIRNAQAALYFGTSLRHYFLLPATNPPTTRGVMPMYKESRAITARLNQTVQEWILTNAGGETDAAVGRQDAHCEAAGATQCA
jgi:hypothetical protein